MHPARAAAHARAFRTVPAPTFLAAAPSPQDPASAVLNVALRHVVRQCTASHDARRACLHNVGLLDRLAPGSRAELQGGGVLRPRCRGDVHPDLTAVVAHFALTPAAAAPQRWTPLARAAATLARVRSESSLASSSSLAGGPPGPALRTVQSTAARTASASPARREQSPGTASPQPSPDGSTLPALCRVFSGLRTVVRRPSAAALDSMVSAPPPSTAEAAGSSPAELAASRSVGGGLGPVMRGDDGTDAALSRSVWRWRVLAAHVEAMAAEARVRQHLWQAAIAAAQAHCTAVA